MNWTELIKQGVIEYIDAEEEEKHEEYEAKNGLLSMFRGYGADGGFVIKFNKAKILDNTLFEVIAFSFCV